MKEGWEYKKLGEVATFVNGYAFKPSQWSEKGIPIIRIQNLNSPNANYNYFEGEIPQKYHVKKGDILISWSASLGAYEWKGNDAYLNQHIFKVVFDKLEIDKHYLRYAVISKLSDMENDAHGATMRHIVKKDFDNTLIPFVSLTKQQKIVEELDLLRSIIEKKKEQLKELDNLAQSIFYDMFGDPVTNEKGWEDENMNSLCIITSSKRIFANEYCEEGVPFYRGKEITELSKGQPISTELNISQKRYEEIKKEFGVPSVGDILITAVGTIGNIWVVSDDRPFYFKDGNIIWLKDIKGFDSVFFRRLLAIQIDAFKNEMAQGCAYNALTIVNLKKMKALSPPLSLQQQFASKIEAIEKQKELIRQSITEVETLFNSRMDYYFN